MLSKGYLPVTGRLCDARSCNLPHLMAELWACAQVLWKVYVKATIELIFELAKALLRAVMYSIIHII